MAAPTHTTMNNGRGDTAATNTTTSSSSTSTAVADQKISDEIGDRCESCLTKRWRDCDYKARLANMQLGPYHPEYKPGYVLPCSPCGFFCGNSSKCIAARWSEKEQLRRAMNDRPPYQVPAPKAKARTDIKREYSRGGMPDIWIPSLIDDRNPPPLPQAVYDRPLEVLGEPHIRKPGGVARPNTRKRKQEAPEHNSSSAPSKPSHQAQRASTTPTTLAAWPQSAPVPSVPFGSQQPIADPIEDAMGGGVHLPHSLAPANDALNMRWCVEQLEAMPEGAERSEEQQLEFDLYLGLGSTFRRRRNARRDLERQNLQRDQLQLNLKQEKVEDEKTPAAPAKENGQEKPAIEIKQEVDTPEDNDTAGAVTRKRPMIPSMPNPISEEMPLGFYD